MNRSKALKDTRTRMKLTQKEMAEKLGVARASLSLYEAGKQTPDLNFLDAFHKVTGAPLDYLMGYTDNYTPETVGLDKTIGLSTKSIAWLAQNADLAELITPLFESDNARDFFICLSFYNKASRADRQKDGEPDALVIATMRAWLTEAIRILKHIYKSDGKNNLTSKRLLPSKEARYRATELINDEYDRINGLYAQIRGAYDRIDDI